MAAKWWMTMASSWSERKIARVHGTSDTTDDCATCGANKNSAQALR